MFKAEQGQRAAVAKAELAQREADTQTERARQEAKLARQRAALEAQQLADEVERRQLELELLEDEEYDQSSAVDRQTLARPTAAAGNEPLAQLRESLRPVDRSSCTRDATQETANEPTAASGDSG